MTVRPTTNTLSYWTDLARLLERGCFDGVFLADVVGLYDVYGGSPAAAPVGTPRRCRSTIRSSSCRDGGGDEHLGFGVTVNLSYEAPTLLARRFTTLDH